MRSLVCSACRHEIAYDDTVVTVGGRRFHSACVEAHRAERPTSQQAVGTFARFFERIGRVLGR